MIVLSVIAIQLVSEFFIVDHRRSRILRGVRPSLNNIEI